MNRKKIVVVGVLLLQLALPSLQVRDGEGPVAIPPHHPCVSLNRPLMMCFSVLCRFYQLLHVASGFVAYGVSFPLQGRV